MLKKLFRPLTQAKWQHNDANIRLKAIEKMDPQQSTILEQLALEDSDMQVREAALNKISDKTLLLELINKQPDNEHLLKRWTQVLSDSYYTDAFDAEQIITACTEPTLLIAIVNYSSNKHFAELALAGLKDETQLLLVMQNTKSTHLWQAIIEKLHSNSSLKQAQSIVKGRNKNALQSIKQKLEKLEQQQHAAQQLQDKQQRLLDKACQLNKMQTVPNLQGEILNLQQQSQLLISTDTDHVICPLKQTQLTQQLQELNDKWEQQQALQAQEQAKIEQEKANAQLSDQLHKIISLLQDHILDPNIVQQCQHDFSAIKLSNTEEKNIKAAEEKAKQLFTLAKSLQEKKLLEQNVEAITKLSITDLEKQLEASSQLLPHCKKLNINKSAIDQLQNLHTTLKQQQKLLLNNSLDVDKKLQDILIKTENLLAENDAINARKNLQSIKSYSQQLNQKSLQKHQSAIGSIHKQLHNLDDWKTYSTEPKREALIDAMNDLINQSLTVDIRLNKIKALQKEWKALGYCENQSLWKSFQKASDTAYLPCKENFAEQKKLREFNAQQRTIICEQLEQFIQAQDFNNSELYWKNIEKLNREIINEWKKFSPLEPQQHKTLQKRFSTSLDLINNAIHQQQLNTEAQLQMLCDEAHKLNEEEDKNAAIKSFQALMQQWKSLNSSHISRHKQQQALWSEFKQAGDALYEGRQNQFKCVAREKRKNSRRSRSPSPPSPPSRS